METFVWKPPAGRSVGALSRGPHPAGATTRPAGPGRLLFDTPGLRTVVIEQGMLPMKLKLWSGGGVGGVNLDDASIHNGTGGGGGAYLECVIPDGLIAYGATVQINVGKGGTVGGFPFGGTSTMQAESIPTFAICPGAVGGDTAYTSNTPGSGGGQSLGYPFFLVDGVLNIVETVGQNATPSGTGTATNGGNCLGPEGGAGGAGSYISSGLNGSPIAGGGGGTRTGGGRIAGNGADGKAVLIWPPDS